MKIRIKSTKNVAFMAIFLSITTILPISSVNADIVRQLYEIELPVKGQTRNERKNIVRDALQEILVRASGRKEAAAIAKDSKLVPQATRFIQQFRYRKFKSDEVIPEPIGVASPYTQKLWLIFSEKAVSKLLRAQGLPVWSKTRPSTLIWLVVDNQKQRVLISNSTSHISRTHIQQEATKRGLPFRLPLLDLADRSKIQVADIWANFEDTILTASKRYQTQAILVGRVYVDFSKSWNTRWTLYSDGKRQDWEVKNNETLQNAVKEGLAKTAEVLSARFTQVSSSEESGVVLLQVKDISDLIKYNKVLKYLKSFSSITAVESHQVNTDNVIFRINSRNGRLGIVQAISLGHMLVEDSDEEDEEEVDLIYKMVQ